MLRCILFHCLHAAPNMDLTAYGEEELRFVEVAEREALEAFIQGACPAGRAAKARAEGCSGAHCAMAVINLSGH